MKKPKNPVLVFLTMAFLLMLIILPPYFRKIIPKQEKVDFHYDKLILLVCKKTDHSNGLEAVSRCKYRNGMFESNTITFTKIEVDSNNPSTNSLTDEYNYLSSILKADTQEETIFKIDSKTIKDASIKEKLEDYISSYESQKKIYENRGYKCTINKN